MSDWQLPPVDPPPPWLPSGASPRTPEVQTPDDSPTAAVLPVPRRSAESPGPISPLRAVAGAAVAVAGVLLGIGALLWATDAPSGSPTVQAPTSQSAQSAGAAPSPATSPALSPSAGPSAVVPPVLPPSPTQAAPVAAAKLPLTVLNNSTRSGLADRAAARFRAGGWPIKLTGNFRGRVEATTVYYAPGQLASAQLLQKSFPGLVRVRPRFATLPGSGLTVVLTRDFPA